MYFTDQNFQNFGILENICLNLWFSPLHTMVKTLTNNTELINILNRLGHGVNYNVLMELEIKNE